MAISSNNSHIKERIQFLFEIKSFLEFADERSRILLHAFSFVHRVVFYSLFQVSAKPNLNTRARRLRNATLYTTKLLYNLHVLSHEQKMLLAPVLPCIIAHKKSTEALLSL